MKQGSPHLHSAKTPKDANKEMAWKWLEEADLHALEGELNTGVVRGAGGGGGAAAKGRFGHPRPRIYTWLIRLSTSALLWTCLIQLMALFQLWQPHLLLLRSWPPCLKLDQHYPSSSFSDFSASQALSSAPVPTPQMSSSGLLPAPIPRAYKSNGYLLVSCNGGLNQMRAAICDMVAIAKLLNVTLVVPELDKTSFWQDPSNFGDIFDVEHFISALRGEVKIVKHVPSKYQERVQKGMFVSMPPVSWSNESYYLNQILPLVKKHKLVHFSKTDARLANNALPREMQKLRCRVNYEALKFTPTIEGLGKKLVSYLKAKGPFLVLHLRYEMDMLAFSGCTHGCTSEEASKLTEMRYAYPWWKEKVIDSEQKRLDGLCPLTPEETALVLQALGFDSNTQIYIAAGEIYGSQRTMSPLYASFPNILRKETLLRSDELSLFQNHSSQMAGLDYLVAIESDVFVPTYDGNMAKVVEGHRRYLGYRKTISLDRKRLVQLLDQYGSKTMTWDEFSKAVRQAHGDLMGAPRRRVVIADQPKVEDYFYSNPEECLS